MKRGEANLIINSIIDECRGRRFSCEGCPFIDERFGHCIFRSLPYNWFHRRKSNYTIVKCEVSDG